MPRKPRQAPGGVVYHVLNRAVGRLRLFQKSADYEAFVKLIGEAHDKFPMRILSFVLMPDHWHFVLWPRRDGDLATFLGWLTHTHSMRFHAQHRSAGSGHLYQGRFRSFPVQADESLYTVCRYLERNPVRAKLVKRPEQWHWSSLWQRMHGDDETKALFSPWPVALPKNWVERVRVPETKEELAALRNSVKRGCPLGSATWLKRITTKLHLEHTQRPVGRPKKEPVDDESGSK